MMIVMMATIPRGQNRVRSRVLSAKRAASDLVGVERRM